MHAKPQRIGIREIVTAPLRFPNLLRYRRWTLQDLYDDLHMPQKLQAVLAGQSGDYLLPPAEVSLLLHVSLVTAYDGGAYYPTHHFSSLVDGLADRVRDAPGSVLLLNHAVARIECRDQRVLGVVTEDGQRFTAARYVSNADPRATMGLLQGFRSARQGKRMSYDYSSSNFTLYLGVRDIDLREHGFGNYNVWHYPHADLNEMYRRQSMDHDLRDPWLFLSTPTLHSDQPGLAPPGHQILEVATSCDYAYFDRLWRRDRKAYTRAKVQIRDRILDVIQENYVPGLRKKLSMKVAGTPRTNERFVRAPFGNAYGSKLTPDNLFPRVPHETELSNLWMVNASAGYPSIGGAVSSGLQLYHRLSGDRV